MVQVMFKRVVAGGAAGIDWGVQVVDEHGPKVYRGNVNSTPWPCPCGLNRLEVHCQSHHAVETHPAGSVFLCLKKKHGVCLEQANS